MKILVLSDIHGDISLIPNIEKELKDADLVFLSGDITHFGRTTHIHKIIEILKPINPNILAVPGNCDYAEVNQYLIEEGYSIDCRYKLHNDLFIMGIGGSLPCPGRTPNEYSEEEFRALINKYFTKTTLIREFCLSKFILYEKIFRIFSKKIKPFRILFNILSFIGINPFLIPKIKNNRFSYMLCIAN